MKVGILTFQDTNNFGSLLQTYALYKVFVDNNIDCEVIDYQCEEIKKREFKYENINCVTLKNIIKHVLFSKGSKKKHKELLEFIKKNVSLSRKYDRMSIDQSNDYYDCFIVGSDIVWGLDVTGKDFSYFLDFASDNKLKMSYASSANEIIGTDYTNHVMNLLSRFELIGVREEKTQMELLQFLDDKEVKLVCDPTMLLESGHWIDLAYSSQYNSELKGKEYILMYFPDGDGRMLYDARFLKKKYRCEIYCINDRMPIPGVRNIYVYKVEDFLCLLLNAKLVLSGSYHGALFSMYFQKEFYYYVRAHGERMRTIAPILGVENRQAKYINEDDTVNYLSVEKKIQQYRTQSYKYIDEMVGIIKKYE
ncbi:MAG: polysaccharide pyruvyl transferase family protein [Lachnospiraceae bacterium]|nr:polysaccharide pyruvyl transferase family protein [Lachnospiraceae bacterium]